MLAEERKTLLRGNAESGSRRACGGVTVYPPQKDVFNAFRLTELGDIKVVILGGIRTTARIRRMAGVLGPAGRGHSAVAAEYVQRAGTGHFGFQRPQHGFLESWAKQGVLLNTVLTVEAGKAHSHARFGWKPLPIT